MSRRQVWGGQEQQHRLDDGGELVGGLVGR
jgi:hypothetical protein